MPAAALTVPAAMSELSQAAPTTLVSVSRSAAARGWTIDREEAADDQQAEYEQHHGHNDEFGARVHGAMVTDRRMRSPCERGHASTR